MRACRQDQQRQILKWKKTSGLDHTRKNGLDGPVIFPLPRLSMHVHRKQTPGIAQGFYLPISERLPREVALCFVNLKLSTLKK